MTGKNHLPYDLENMSIPELEALLQQDFIASNGGAPDVDYIMAIVEVIQKKEQEQPNYQPPDAERAWEEFLSNLEAGEDRGHSIYDFVEEAGSQSSVPVGETPRRKKPNTVRKRFIAAFLIAALMAATLIPVSGYANVIQMVIAYWTDDYFSFSREGRSTVGDTPETDKVVPLGFEELWDFAQEHGMQDLAIPWYIPEGFQVEDANLYEFDLSDGFVFYIVYLKDNDRIGIYISKNYKTSGVVYEKDKSDVETYELNGAECFIFNNNGENVSTTCLDGVEYIFGTTLSKNELKQIVDSIHGE